MACTQCCFNGKQRDNHLVDVIIESPKELSTEEGLEAEIFQKIFVFAGGHDVFLLSTSPPLIKGDGGIFAVANYHMLLYYKQNSKT